MSKDFPTTPPSQGKESESLPQEAKCGAKATYTVVMKVWSTQHGKTKGTKDG